VSSSALGPARESALLAPGTPSTPDGFQRPARRETRAVWQSGLLIALIVIVMVMGIAILITTGNPLFAVAPALVAGVVSFVWTQPLRRTLVPVIFAQMVVFSPPFEPSSPLWSSVFEPGFRVMVMHLNKTIPLGFLSLSGQETIYIMLFFLIMIRIARGQRIDEVGQTKSATVLFFFLGLSLLMVTWLETWGLARGGSFKSSLFQIRQLLWLPLQVFVLSYALRDSADFKRIGLVITLAAMVKAAVGSIFVAEVLSGGGESPPFMTSHEDSVLYVSVMFMWIAAWVHQQNWQRLAAAAVVVVWILIAIVLNNRRLAWVGVVGCCLVFYPLVGGRLKRRLKLALIALAPLIATYFIIARSYSGGIFKPGADLVGIANTKDGSTLWRLMENQNMVLTFRAHRLFGSGFGHEWYEYVPLPTVAENYAEYRLIAHNSLLWLMGVAGTIGFMVIWMPIVVGVYLAARSYHQARNAADRNAAVTVLVVAVCYVNHAWADIGIGTPVPTFLLACALALAGKLATETGAWPSRAKLT
jgi:O-Antigen ligase